MTARVIMKLLQRVMKGVPTKGTKSLQPGTKALPKKLKDSLPGIATPPSKPPYIPKGSDINKYSKGVLDPRGAKIAEDWHRNRLLETYLNPSLRRGMSMREEAIARDALGLTRGVQSRLRPNWESARSQFTNRHSPLYGNVPRYYEKFPKKTLETHWMHQADKVGDPATLSKMLRTHYRRKAPIGRKLELMERGAIAQPMSVGARIKRIEDLAGHTLPNPLKTRIRERLMGRRGQPGTRAGLDRMDARTYSQLNEPGSVVAGTKRSFLNMLRTDKGFEQFVVDMVGSQNVSKVLNSPKLRKELLKDYQRTL